MILGWLWRLFGLVDRDGPAQVEYDPVYGLSQRALDDWLRANPRLAAEHQRAVERLRGRSPSGALKKNG